jgi:fatty-acyl-CoA synthase
MVLPYESFEPLKVLQAVEKERCTSLYGVPTMFIAELQCPNLPVQSVFTKNRHYGGPPCPVEVMKK